MSLKLGIDVDGVSADFNGSFIDLVVKVTGEDRFPARPFDIPTWNYPEHYGYSRAQTTAVWDVIESDPSFWFKLEPYTWTRKFLTRLNQFSLSGAEVYFITNRMGVAVKKQTEDWLRWNTDGFSDPTVLISAEKGLCAKALSLDAYIDDRDLNVLDVWVKSQTTKTFLLDQPWNRTTIVTGDSDIYRISDPNQMLAALAG